MRLPWYLVAGFSLLVSIQAAAQTSIFIEPPQYAVGEGPLAIVVGDFNGDGKLDLAVSNNCPTNGCSSDISTVSILLGNGDGTFQPHVDYPVGTPAGLAVADFNGDGKLDLAVANGSSVAILLGNGDGTFQAAVDYVTPGTTSSVAVGDFNGDGKPDLVVTNSDDNSVSVFLNSGSGTFPTRQDLATGSYPTSVTVGDFNGDGKLDLATAECGNSTNCDGGSVSILLGNGNGTFQAHVDYMVEGVPMALAAADLNGDGFLDLAVVNSNSQSGSASGSVSVLFGAGNGTFQTQQVYPAGTDPLSIAVGDFNGDGKLDFTVTTQGDLEVYLNQGNGTFSQPTVLYGTGGFASAVATGDFNGDQKLDLAIPCDNANISGVCILLGQGNGSFSPTSLSYPTGAGPDAVAISDLNGDSKNDIAVANFNDNNVGVFLGNGDGTVQPPVNYSTGIGPSALAIADVNGDGKPDLVVANQTANTVSVLLNNGNGTFLTHIDYPTADGPVSVAIGDLNGDGKLDLAVACGNNVSLLFGNGDGTFQGHIDYGADAASIVLGDFNGDGILDFAVVDNTELTLFLNNGSGSFGAKAVPLASLRVPTDSRRVGRNRSSKEKARPEGAIANLVLTDYTAIAAADFNADGKLDLVVSGAGGFNDAGLLILLGNGDGTFQAPISLDSPPGNSITIADFNGDGVLDIAVGTPDEDGVALSLGNGDGTFQTALEYAAGFVSVAAGDLNGDGKPDLASVSGPEGAVNSDLLTILLNAGQVASSFKLAASPASQTVSDWNSATFTITGTTSNGFTGTVTLTCRLYLGEGSTCTPKPSSIIPTASGASSTVTVTTNASTAVGTYALTVTGASGLEQFTVSPLVTVTPAVPAFGVSTPAAATPSSVPPGQPSTATVTAGSMGGFAGTVALACSVSPMPLLAPTCSLSPAQAQVAAGGQATSTLTISTTGPTASLSRPSLRHDGSLVYAVVFPIIGLSLMGAGAAFDGRRKKILGLVLGCVVLGGLLLQVACGGGGGNSSTNTTSTPGTPAGSYTVTVTGSSGSTQHTTAVTLTVQ